MVYLTNNYRNCSVCCAHRGTPKLVQAVIKLKKLKALPFLRVHSSFSKCTVSTLDGALD